MSLLNLQGHCYKLVTKRSRLEVRQNFLATDLWAPGIGFQATSWKPLPSTAPKTDFTGRREGHRKASEVRQDMA